MIYPEQRGDYFTKSWSAVEFNDQFEILMDDEAYIAVAEEGFARLNILEKIVGLFKDTFGGTDYSQRRRVQGAWLKFLYYGEAHGYLKDGQIKRLHDRIHHPYQHFDKAIGQLFQKMQDYHQFPDEPKSEYLSDLRDIVTDYHQRQAAFLRPGFWTRIFTAPSLLIDPRKLFLFGDAPLQLSQQALGKEANPDLAFTYLKRAFDLKNDSPEFQEELAAQLEEIESSEIKGEQRKIQDLWIELGKTAFENELPDLAITHLERALQVDSKNTKARILIGKLYLANKEYDSAQPFLAELQKTFSQNLQMQISIGDAYWQLDEFQEALIAYEAAASCYQKQAEKSRIPHQKQMGSIYHQMGTAHLKKLISTGTTAQAISFLTLAVKTDPTALDYQEDLYEAYVQQWQTSPANFAAAHGEGWLKFLALSHATLMNKWKTQIIQISLDCSEQHFKANLNQKAHACLDKTLDLFDDDADIKIQALDLAIFYGDCSPLQSKLYEWEDVHYANPYLQQKIGDAYWNSDQTQAMGVYQKSLDLFAQKLPFCQVDAERKDYQQHMADMQARIGQTQLQTKPGFFSGIPYDEAIKNLEQAASTDPDHYATLLHDACLSAAQAEKQRNALMRDTNKIIAYYQKIFQALGQKGDYVIELLQLCIDKQRYDDAISIYYDIQKQSWAEEFELPAPISSKLASLLFKRKDYQETLTCLIRAYEAEPQNQKFKEDYFQLVLALAKDKFQKLQKGKAKEEDLEEEFSEGLLEIAENLEACWNEGFDEVEDFEEPYQELFVKIYHALADRTIQQCLLPQSIKEMTKAAIQKHKKDHEAEIQQALDYYTKALSYQPENAALHFDRGLLLNWTIEYEEALEEFQLAVKHQPGNPFYHKMLAPLYFAVHVDMNKKEEHEQLATKYAAANFAQDFRIWEEEHMSQIKTKPIDPHAYTQQKKGWFG